MRLRVESSALRVAMDSVSIFRFIARGAVCHQDFWDHDNGSVAIDLTGDW